MTRIVLIRHGETEWNRLERFQGRTDVPLNQEGLEQAERLAQRLKEVPLTKIYTSPLIRARKTAEIVNNYHGVEIIPEEGLTEVDHGHWTGMFKSQVIETDGERYKTWLTRPDTLVVPEGESLADVYRRSVRVIEKIIESSVGETILVCSHDAVNKVLLCHFFGLELSNFWKFKQGNGCINIIDVLDRSSFTIMLVNDTCHLGGIIDRTAQGAL